MGINVNIIDGDYCDVSEVEYRQIKEEYLNWDLTVQEIRNKHGLPNKRWGRIKKRIFDETGYSRRNHTREGVKNYYQTRDGNWLVQKIIDGHCYKYGVYETEGQAVLVVRILRKYGWNLDNIFYF